MRYERRGGLSRETSGGRPISADMQYQVSVENSGFEASSSSVDRQTIVGRKGAAMTVRVQEAMESETRS